MKSKIIALALAAASVVGLSGCATMDRSTAYTAGGAVAGGLVGNAIGGTGGAILGAAGGAYVGNQASKR